MGEAYILHGCVDDWHAAPRSMRMYVPTAALRHHLETRECRYVDPDEDGDGDVLTVDDSTRGAAQACLLARELGHAVTLFVNPSQIESGRDYWFSRFDALVDARRAVRATFDGITYDLDTWQGMHDFRWAVRPRLLPATEQSADRLLDEVASILDAVGDATPTHARSIDLAEFAALHRAGVRFGNHGWDHQCLSGLSPADQRAQLDDTAEWLAANTGRRPRDYAVPFGQERLAPIAYAAVPGTAYLVDSPTAADAAGYRCRRNLTPALQQAVSSG